MRKVAPSALACLAGPIAPEVLNAPKTGADPDVDMPDVERRVVRYLAQHVVGQPWDHHLVLLAAILSAQRRDPATVRLYVQVLHPRLRDLFAVYHLRTMQEWDAERMVTEYCNGIVLPEHSNNQRLTFWKHYRQAVQLGQNWLASLPTLQQPPYERFLFPALPTANHASAHLEQIVREAQHRERKLDTEALVPHFASIRLQAQLRVNQLTRLRNAYLARVNRMRDEPADFPIPFVYEEFVGTGSVRRVVERWHFRIWDRRSFVLHPEHGYSAQVQGMARRRAAAFRSERNTLFLEFVRAEHAGADDAAQGPWFIELVKRGVLGQAALSGNRAEKQAWLRAWGHGHAASDTRLSAPFLTATPEILAPGLHDSRFLLLVNQHSQGVVFQIEPLYVAAVFGALALQLFTTTGMRINEALQLRPTRDCIIYVEKPAPVAAQHQVPSGQFVLRLIPKGERRDRPADYYIDTEAVQLIARVGALLQEHYHLGAEDSLPVVAYHAHNPRAHRFGAAPYLFQYHRHHLHRNDIVACMRFLSHGMVFPRPDGKPVIVTPHLLRHVFATHMLQVEKMPIDILGAILHQKNLDVTAYYGQATGLMVAETAQAYLLRIAAHIHLGEAALRAPNELRQKIVEAQHKAGTLANVIGGTCTQPGFCPAKFVCIGCPSHVPELEKRYQIEQHQAWAREQCRFAEREGLLPMVERMKQVVRDCETELAELDMMAVYRNDRAYIPLVQYER